jgi:glutamate synthase (NADPH/NADH) large chain
MTGGLVAILGDIGINFGAGMTGGLAWVLDDAQTLIREERYHTEFLEAQTFAETTPEQQAALKALIEEHVTLAHSSLGLRLLAEWDKVSAKFVLFTPKPQA